MFEVHNKTAVPVACSCKREIKIAFYELDELSQSKQMIHFDGDMEALQRWEMVSLQLAC